MLLERLKDSLKNYFDFYEDYEFAGYTFPLHAKFFRRNSRYFAVKKAEIYAFSNFEYLFVHRVASELDPKSFADMLVAFKLNMDELVRPNDEHMSSVLTIIIECERVEGALAKKIEKFKYRKNYRLGFYGWADIKVIVIARGDGSIVESRLARGDSEKMKIKGIYPARHETCSG